ncbi:hypothetical protein PSEUBRA_005832 [Kalmanozyma brasiliensis GHG001]|uniref:uncharacterized protein n=1 Tax=Kalmanozyma brasiliensis (strain GHG001) TaxID=1365824 RepID=UPI0028683263|nr:uncharacterized protein PSEUBRA_005832 [Kalmanozyma brasiliensis GHG001]KAF6767564.1 hypothetical protein PSEUBRA_005832 [Kalmanozyma brasiliensis GHG001]
MPHLHLLALLYLLLTLPFVVRAPPPPRPAPLPLDRAHTHYEHLYHSLTSPLALYSVEPPIYAPVSSPRGTARLSQAMRDYPRLVNAHEAYIGPHAGDAKTAADDLVDVSGRIVVARGTGSFLALLEELSSRSRREIRTPLHPENVAAQHRAPLSKLEAKLTELLELIDDNAAGAQRWTHRLSAEENERWLDARETLQAEKVLLGVAAKRYAGRFPHKGGDAIERWSWRQMRWILLFVSAGRVAEIER